MASEVTRMRVDVVETVQGTQPEVWRGWPVSWSAVWVGALATVAFAMVVGLLSVAVGAHELGAAGQITNWREVSRAAVVFAIFGAFLSAALGVLILREKGPTFSPKRDPPTEGCVTSRDSSDPWAFLVDPVGSRP
jgi:hypothetical protein